MKKNKGKDTPRQTEATAQAAEPKHSEAPSERLHRVSVRISESDFRDMQAHFLEGKAGRPLVSVHPPQRRLTDAQREYRKAYRQRPDVKEKMKAYRAARRQRVREVAKQAAEQPNA